MVLCRIPEDGQFSSGSLLVTVPEAVKSKIKVLTGSMSTGGNSLFLRRGLVAVSSQGKQAKNQQPASSWQPFYKITRVSSTRALT